jgi:hypothetical protein
LKFGKQEEMIFDKIYTTCSGQLLGVEIRASADNANMVFLTGCLAIYEDLHEKLGHPREQVVQNTAKHYGMKTRDKQKKCVHYKTSFRGERINIDITHVNTPSYGGAKFCLMVQDDFTDYLEFLSERKIPIN